MEESQADLWSPEALMLKRTVWDMEDPEDRSAAVLLSIYDELVIMRRYLQALAAERPIPKEVLEHEERLHEELSKMPR